MNTFHHNQTSHVMATLFAILTTVLGSTAWSEEPLPTTNEPSVAPHDHADVSAVRIHSLQQMTFLTSDNGNARPREDVIPIRTAIRQSADDSQLKISSRYTSSEMLGFLSRTNMSELSSLYLEASQMIDARHVSPTSYEDRTANAIRNLVAAVENDAFLQANGTSARPQQIQSLQRELEQVATTQPARTANEAIGLMQWASELANRRLGVRREAVALEFLNGTIDSLDKYSAFLPTSVNYGPGADIELVRTAGLEENIVGIGVELRAHDVGAEILGTIENSPAEELGLQSGDLILAINRRSVRGQNLNQIADQIAGPAGTSLTLDIDRSGQKYRGSLARRKVYVSSVAGAKMIDPENRTGYVRLKQFSASSTTDLQNALWGLHRNGMRSLILDLRGNPGGLLDEAVNVSNLFVPCGTIVSTRGRSASDNTQEPASYEKTWSVPLVVLVDGNSASASEIFAAAIQENGRGLIVGRRSYGKGTVQTHFPLQTVGGQLKLTTAKFFSPNGREMAGAGVSPDVVVPTETTSTGFRGADTDPDIQMAFRQLSVGTPQQLATNAAQCRRPASR